MINQCTWFWDTCTSIKIWWEKGFSWFFIGFVQDATEKYQRFQKKLSKSIWRHNKRVYEKKWVNQDKKIFCQLNYYVKTVTVTKDT